MSPSVLSEDLVRRFKYWNDGIQEGMNHNGELYALVRSYSLKARLQAYELGCSMSETGIDTCVTCSNSGYTVWMNLKSLALQSTDGEASQPRIALAEVAQ